MDLSLLKDELDSYLMEKSLRLSLVRSQKERAHCNKCGSPLYMVSSLMANDLIFPLHLRVGCQAMCGFQLTMMMKVPDSIIRKFESKIKVKEIVEAMRAGIFPDPDEPPPFRPTG